MPEEPNPRMDEILKAYAQARREQAGTPPPLHPATRNLLQGEAARTYKSAPATTTPKVDFWESMRLRLMVIGSACATLLIFAFVFFQHGNFQRMNRQKEEVAQNELQKGDRKFTIQMKRDGSEEFYAKEGNRRASPPPESKAGERQLEEAQVPLPSTSAPALPPADAQLDGQAGMAERSEGALEMEMKPVEKSKLRTGDDFKQTAKVGSKAHALAVAKGGESTGKDASALGANRGAVAQNAPPAAPAAAPAPPPIAKKTTRVISRRGQFQQLGIPRPDETYGFIAPKRQPVLNSFELQQTGETIQIIDADGSTYSGRVGVAETAVAKAPAVAQSEALAAPTFASEAKQEASKEMAAQGVRPPDQPVITFSNFSFCVKGENRSLKQAVELRGRFTGDLGFLQSSSNLALHARQAKAGATATPMPTRIQGEIFLNGTNVAELNAVLVEPKARTEAASEPADREHPPEPALH